jgi:hypothetical protein
MKKINKLNGNRETHNVFGPFNALMIKGKPSAMKNPERTANSMYLKLYDWFQVAKNTKIKLSLR